MSAPLDPDSASLERTLRTLGVACRVDARERLAILLVDGAAANTLAEESFRRRIVALLPQHGFTHVALELEDDAGVGS